MSTFHISACVPPQTNHSHMLLVGQNEYPFKSIVVCKCYKLSIKYYYYFVALHKLPQSGQSCYGEELSSLLMSFLLYRIRVCHVTYSFMSLYYPYAKKQYNNKRQRPEWGQIDLLFLLKKRNSLQYHHDYKIWERKKYIKKKSSQKAEVLKKKKLTKYGCDERRDVNQVVFDLTSPFDTLQPRNTAD